MFKLLATPICRNEYKNNNLPWLESLHLPHVQQVHVLQSRYHNEQQYVVE